MEGLGFLRYAFGTVVRNRRRTLSAIIGIVLAIAFIAGSNIAIDSTVRSIMDSALAGVQTDFYASENGPRGNNTPPPSHFENVSRSLAAVPGVLQVEPIMSVPLQVKNFQNFSGIFPQVIAARPSYFGRLPGATLQGDLTLGAGKVVVGKAAALALKTQVGGVVSLYTMVYSYRYNKSGAPLTLYFNLTVEGIASLPERQFQFSIGTRFTSGALLIGLGQASDVIRRLNAEGGPSYSQTQYSIWVDRDKIVDPYDIDGTHRRLTRIGDDLQIAASYEGLFVSSLLPQAVQSIGVLLSIERVVLLAFSLPVVLLGIHLGATGNELGMSERRRELGIIKARGAGSGQVFALLLLEALALGAVAGVIGLALGFVTSRFLLGAVAWAGQAPTSSYLGFGISALSVYLAIGFAVVFTLIASYRSSHRYSRLPVTEGLQFYSPGEVRIAYRPTIDIILVTIAALVFAFTVYSRQLLGTASVVLFLVGAIFTILAPFAPILLILGITRLLTRSTAKVYALVSRGLRFLTRELSDVVTKNLMRNPRRSSNVCVIIALGIAFGVFLTVMNGTQAVYEERQLKASIGSDIQIQNSFGFTANNSAVLSNLSKVDGVEVVSAFASVNSALGSVALDSSTYGRAVQLENYYFVAGGPGAALEALGTPGNAIVSKEYAERYDRGVGDTLTWRIQRPSGFALVPLKIVAVVKAMPGLASPSYGFYQNPGGPPAPAGFATSQFESFTGPAVFVDYTTVGENPQGVRSGNLSSSNGYLVKVKAGFDPSRVRENISATIPTANIRVFNEELTRLRSNPIRNASLSFLSVEMAYVVLILTVGLGLISYAASLERESEFASIAARGASTSQVSTLLLGEALTIMIVGLAIGVSTGLLSAAVFNQLLSSLAGPSQLDRALILPLDSLLLVGLASLAMVVISFMTSLRIRFMNLARVLKIRGG